MPTIKFLLMFVTVLVTAHCDTSQGFSGYKSSSKPAINFSQNLTSLINKIIYENNSTSKQLLAKALKFSPIVFYETDWLLSDISNILPVISLLEQVKANKGTHPKIILSLRYVNQTTGRFLWTRLGDIFYTLNTTLSLNHRTKIVSHLTSIVLNFKSDVYETNQFYEDRPYPNDISFPVYCKNFLNLHFGLNAISVGVLYGKSQVATTQKWRIAGVPYINRQLDSANFTIYSEDLDLHNDFPIFLEEFVRVMAPEENTTRPFTLLNIMANSNPPHTNQIYPYCGQYNYWWRSLHRVLSSVTTHYHYNITSQLFLEKAFVKAPGTFTQVVYKWALAEGQDVIINNPCHEYSLEQPKRRKFVVPLFKNDEGEINLDDAKGKMITWKEAGAVVLTEKSWRGLTRFQTELIQDSSSSKSRVNVTLKLSSGLAEVWPDINKYLHQLIYTQRNISQLWLSRIVFTEDDIYESGAIHNFLEAAKTHNFSIGCSVPFVKLQEIYYHTVYYDDNFIVSSSAFKKSLEKSLCQPIFHIMDTLIWTVDDGESIHTLPFKRTGLFGNYSDVFLAREIFLREFPSIQVIIHFASSLDKNILADLYEVPVIQAV